MKSEEEVNKRLNNARMKEARLKASTLDVLGHESLKAVKIEIKTLEWVINNPPK